MTTKQASVLTLWAQRTHHLDLDRADSSDCRGWGTCGWPVDVDVKECCLPGGSSLPHPPPPAPKQVKQTTEEEDKQPHVLLLSLFRNGMRRSAQLIPPDVEPKHRQLLTVHQPGLNSGSTGARRVHWETMKE